MTESRKNIMLGTAGHVDHGKTALVKILTGCDTDTLAVEKQRGLTIELGFAPCRMRDERIVGIVDVPGHVNFIRNMVAGAHGIDVVILVVAADDSVMPQTREHLDILTLMGVRHGLVAMTKIDLGDEETRQIVADDIAQLVAGTFLEGAPVCGISNVTGEGFDGFFSALNDAVAACEGRADTGLFRHWIERSFTIRGFGTVVSGVPTSGEVHVGDRLRLVPGERVARVRGLEVYGEQAEVGRAGECVAINIADVDQHQLARGRVLCEGEAFEAVGMAEAQLGLLEGAALKDYAEVHVHVGTAEVMANVALLAGVVLRGVERQMVQLRLAQPLGLAPGDRFVIRCPSAGAGGRLTTIGGGRILDTSNIRLKRNRPWTLAALAARRDAIDSPAQWCAAILAEAGSEVHPEQLAAAAKMRADQVAGLLDGLRADGTVLDAPGGAVVHARVIEHARGRVAEALEAFHSANPKRLGMIAGDLLAAAQLGRGVFEVAVAALIEAGKIEHHGELLALAGQVMKLSSEDQVLCEAIEQALREAGLTPPLPQELARAVGAEMDRFSAMVRLLADRGRAVQLDPKVILHTDTLTGARQVVLDLFRKHSGFSTMDFRDALGVSRKYAVPILDHFDSIRLTVRSGNRRTPGAGAKELL